MKHITPFRIYLISILFILIFSFFLYFPNYSFAYTESECAALSGEAKSEFAAKKILFDCSASDGFFSKSKELKCAIKAGKAATESAAKAIYYECW